MSGMNRVTSKDGTSIAYDKTGHGPALILVDGALCYRESGPSGPLAEQLSEDFTVYTYDRRGRGDSDENTPYAVEKEVEDIEAELFFEKVEAYWNESIERYFRRKLPAGEEPKVPIEILTNHISGTLFNLLKWWVNDHMSYTPSQMESYFKRLINPCIDSIIYNHSVKA